MIYILRSSNYEESFIVGVTTCPFEAENLKKEYLVKLAEKKAMYSEKEIEMLNAEFEECNIMTDSMLKHRNWLYDIYYMDYSNEVNIQEVKENTMICYNLKD